MGGSGRARCTSLVVGSAIAISGNAAFAQADPPCTKDCPEPELIIITGSRIPSPESGPAPLQRNTADEIDHSGVVNLQELLNEQPIFGVPAFNRTNSNFATSNGGAATVNLRNLGDVRTLVLLNGRRLPPNIPGTGVVDLNVIPTQLVSRVEVLTGGASSIYGSDAVAGVVNIILDDRFTGLKAEAQYGLADAKDDSRRQASLTYGTKFAGDRGHFILHGSWSDEGAVRSRTRKRTRFGQIDCFRAEDGSPFKSCGTILSPFAPQGRIETNNGLFTFGPNGELLEGFFTNGAPGRPPDGYNTHADRLVAIPTQRYLVYSLGQFELSDHVTARTEASFSRSRVRSQLEALALDSSEMLFADSGGYFNIEHDLVGPGGSIVRVRNPLVPDEIFNSATDTNGDGLRDVSFRRRMSEFGDRSADSRRTGYRLLGGLDGDISGGWRWGVFYAFGRSTEKQISRGRIDLGKFKSALDVGPDILDFDRDGDVSETICLDPAARDQGCVPANIFGGAGALAPTRDYLQVDARMSALMRQNLAGGSVVGPLFQLAAGDADAAFGFEYRKEFTRLEFDELTQSGGNGDTPVANVTGGFHVIEGYSELTAPIVADHRLVELLKLHGSVRVSSYSTVGTTWNWGYGVEYAPFKGLRFRATKARANRAPNISELFAPQSQGPESFVEDPCIGVTETTLGPLGTSCRTYPGVVANIAQNGAFTIADIDRTFLVSFGGNPHLQEETADSLTIGIVVNPAVGKNRALGLTIDYFDVDVAGAIFPLSVQTILNQCFREGRADFCNLIARRTVANAGHSAGSLEGAHDTIVNSGGLHVRGIDATLNYRLDVLGGRLRFSVAYTHLMKGFVFPLPDSSVDGFAGEIGSPRDRALATLNYDRRQWGVTVQGNYLGPAFLDDQFGADRSTKFQTGSEFVLDAQLRFAPSDRFELYFGADNLFDNAPPFLGFFGTPGTNTDASAYDAIGRRFYAGVRIMH